MEHVSKQLILSGRLQPEGRLGVAISEFAQALDDGRRQQFRQMQTTCSNHISGLDVIRLTEEINKEGSRRHRSWRAYGTKIGSFLSRLQMFASIGDVLIGGSQNLIATGIWSAVRLCLTSATSFLGYFEKLSALFLKLGTSWALHEDFAQLFPNSKDLQTHLCEYLILVLKLCCKITTFSRKNLASQLLSSLGTTFEDEFGLIQEELVQRSQLIQQTAQHLATKSLLDAESKSAERFGGLSRLIAREADKTRSDALKYRILQHLCPSQSQHETTWRRQRRKGTCKWIYQSKSFQDWKSMKESSSLCVSGNLGNGKTVAIANIVAELNLERPCAYFFCMFKEPESLKATTVLRSIACHLLDSMRDDTRMWDSIVRKYGARLPNISSPEQILKFLLKSLPKDRQYVVILDGLEDCSDDEVDDILSSLVRLMRDRTVLLCYSARSDSRFQGRARQLLNTRFAVSLNENAHDEEIKDFIVKEISLRNVTRHLSPELEDLVVKQLVAWSQGMYLWVSLQIESIFPSDSRTVVTEERTRDLITNLPRDLPETFERALEGIIDKSYEGNILKLVMAAEYPLTVDQLRAALAVKPGVTKWFPERVPIDGAQLMCLCGGNLLDVDDEDGTIRFIHHSIIQHLLSKAMRSSTILFHFSLEEAHNFAGSICVTYLHLPMFESRMIKSSKVPGEEVVEQAKAGAKQSHPVIGLLAQYMKSRKQLSHASYDLDLGLLVLQGHEMRHDESFNARCFHKYAAEHWLTHTEFFREDDAQLRTCWALWWQILSGQLDEVELPFLPLNHDLDESHLTTHLDWASFHEHIGLFRVIMELPKVEPVNLIGFLVNEFRLRNTIHDEWLDLVTIEMFHLSRGYCATPNLSVNTAPHLPINQNRFKSRVRFLAALGAELTAIHARSPSQVHELDRRFDKVLIAYFENLQSDSPGCYPSFKSVDALATILPIRQVQETLKGEWLFEVLRDLHDNGNDLELGAICIYHPLLQTTHGENPLGRIGIHKHLLTIIGTAEVERMIADITQQLDSTGGLEEKWHPLRNFRTRNRQRSQNWEAEARRKLLTWCGLGVDEAGTSPIEQSLEEPPGSPYSTQDEDENEKTSTDDEDDGYYQLEQSSTNELARLRRLSTDTYLATDSDG